MPNDHMYEVKIIIRSNTDRKTDIYASVLASLRDCPVIDQVGDIEVTTHDPHA